jgi:hypothetical protein
MQSVDAQSISFRKEISITLDGDQALNPLVTVRANDDFVVAGNSTASRSAWAAKMSPAGDLIWTYTEGLFAADIAAFRGASFSPRFADAVAMPDGSTYLCGSLPRPPAEYAPGLLVHLDSKGRLLAKYFVLPLMRNTHGIARFSSCIRWGDGVAILGDVWHSVRAGEDNAPNPSGPAYWLVIVDGNGQIVTDAQIRPSVDLAAFDVGPIVSVPNSGTSILFGVTDNHVSEFIRANVHGKVEAVRRLAGRFVIVRPVLADGLLQIYGAFLGDKSQSAKASILLDDRLNTVSQISGAYPSNFATRIAYRMPDRSLVLFGSSVNASATTYHSRIVHEASDLQSASGLDLPREKIEDAGSIWAAAPASNLGEFAVATMAVARGVNSTATKYFRANDFKKGAVLDFVRVE